LPPAGEYAIFVDTDGTLKQMDSTGAVTAIGGAGFSSDVLLKLPNSATTPVNALELLTALSVNTPGSEASTFLTKLINLGVTYNALNLTPAGKTTDSAAGTTTWTWTLNVAGAAVGQIQASSAGGVTFSGNRANGALIFRATAAGADLLHIGTQFGIEAEQCAIQATQGANVALATTLACLSSSPNGGNTFVISAGTGPASFINSGQFDNGAEINLFFSVAATLKHNQTPGGGQVAMQLAGSVDASMAIGGRIKFVLINGQGFVELGRVAA